NAADWTKLLNANSGYMAWKLGAAQSADEAAAQRTAALRSLAVRYGGLPAGFQDPYGDITPEYLGISQQNPLSETARLERDYGQSRTDYERGLAARGALQSGDLGYGLDRLQTQHAQDLYDLANQFTGEAQGYVNQYASTLQGLDQDQINAI